MKRRIVLFLSFILMLTACGTVGNDNSVVSAADTGYEYKINDIVALQKYLLNKITDEEISDKPFDLNSDDRLNVIVLCIMKREIMSTKEAKSDTLVVYFSRTGNTEKIAEYLIEITGADSHAIQAAEPYSDEDIAYQTDCRANREQNDRSVRPEIAAPMDSIDGYDTIFLGYPIWWGEEPRIIDTFLESYDFSDKTVIPFCTSASSGISVSEKNIAELVPIGKQLTGRRFSASATKDDVKAWYDSLGHIDNITQDELKEIPGEGDVTVTLSLKK